MNILYWTPIFWPDIGGIELITLRLIESMKKRGHEIVVLTSHGRFITEDISNLNGICIHRFPMVSSLYNNDLRQLLKIQKEILKIKDEFRPDIEHLNFGGPVPMGFFYLRTAKTNSPPLIVSLHNFLPLLPTIKKTITRRLVLLSSWTTGVSEAILENASKIVPEISNRSSVIHNGLTIPTLPHIPIQFDPPKLLCIGRVTREKGFDLAIKVFKKLLLLFPKARLIIVGDGLARHDLELQVKELDLESAVEFFGWVSHEKIPSLIDMATIVLMPSRWQEPFGLVALQAAQRARPVIATNIGGLPEVVIHEKTGLLFEKDNSQELLKQIIFLLHHPKVSVSMGEAAYKRAKNVFSITKMTIAYDGLYQNILNNKISNHV